MPSVHPISHISRFKQSIEHIALPTKFTFPFCYQPSKIAQVAVSELQERLASEESLKFPTQGRMFGVLVVRDNSGELGYLTALSGTQVCLTPPKTANITFVPDIFEGFSRKSDYVHKQQTINDITQSINQLESSATFTMVRKQIADLTEQAGHEISHFQQLMVENRQQRKIRRTALALAATEKSLTEEQIKRLSIQLSRESVQDKKVLSQLKAQWKARLSPHELSHQAIVEEISDLKKARRKLSAALQRTLFKQYQLLNVKGEQADLLSLFRNTAFPVPPAGSGDCAAPKLLQYAFKHQLAPISMAEFWWGASPQSEIRKHGLFYPACQGKCKPILTHMLSGMSVEPNPMLNNPAANIDLEIIYQDDDLIVVNKPAGLLSVPGKTIKDSVHTRIKQRFPHASGPMIVHRLDMATSGLLMLSLNERAHKGLQKQFINREVRKQYTALLDGKVKESNGVIILPLRGDINDRPRQLVCHQSGKPAKTEWQLVAYHDNQSRLKLSPITGRTHQLRVHCAHPEGLDMAITGDDLYGTSNDRLHLHAQYLAFSHPITKQPLQFDIAPDF